MTEKIIKGICCIILLSILLTVNIVRGDYDFQGERNTDPKDIQTHLKDGYTYLKQDLLDEAESEFNKALRIDSKSTEAYNGLGMVYAQRSNSGFRAIKYFEKALKDDPRNLDGLVNLGKVWLRLGSWDGRRIAKRVFNKIIKFYPDLPDGYYHLGTIHKKYKEYDEAIEVFSKLVSFAPDYQDAYYQLGLSYKRLRRYSEAVKAFEYKLDTSPKNYQAIVKVAEELFNRSEYEHSIDLLNELVERNLNYEVDSSYPLIILAWNYFELKDDTNAMKFFEQAFDEMNEKEKGYYSDLELVLNRNHAKNYKSLTGDEKRDYHRVYWQKHDPTPTTEINERLIEHYRRVSYSRANFSKGKTPWDRRGDIYIRFGEPNYRSPSRKVYDTKTLARVDSIKDKKLVDIFGPEALELSSKELSQLKGIIFQNSETSRSEHWFYFNIGEGIGIEFILEDTFSNGNYNFPFPAKAVDPVTKKILPIDIVAKLDRYDPAIIAQNVIAETPEKYSHDYEADPIDFPFYTADFRGSEKNERSTLELYYGIPAKELTEQKIEGQMRLSIESALVLFDSTWTEVERIENLTELEGDIASESFNKVIIPDILRVSSYPGNYHFALSVKEKISNKIGIYKGDIEIDSYKDVELKLSDIILAGEITQSLKEDRFFRNGLKIVPLPSKVFARGGILHSYYEIYNLTKDQQDVTEFRVDYTVKSISKDVLSLKIFSSFGKLLGLSREPGSITISYEHQGLSETSTEIGNVSVDISDSTPGSYKFIVTITDLINGKQVSKSTNFSITEM